MGLYLIGKCHLPNSWGEGPKASDDATDQPWMSEAIDALLKAIPWAGGKK